MTISLTDIEIQRVLSACDQYIDLMYEGEDTHEYTAYEMETGLGSALRKLNKGRNGRHIYEKYKTVNQCPTFEEWRAARAEREDE